MPTKKDCKFCAVALPPERSGTVMHVDACGCAVHGQGLLPNPWHVHRCAIHAAAESALALLNNLLDEFGEAYDDPDEEVDGSDAVEALGSIVRGAQDIIQRPGYTGELAHCCDDECRANGCTLRHQRPPVKG